MPSPWKKARLGGISRLLVSNLRSKAKRGVGDSSLVVQAGFPTSVADLVVKNRSRLKKPPRWRRQPCADEGGDAGCSTVATLVSEIITAAASDAANPKQQRSPVAGAVKRRVDAVPEAALNSPTTCSTAGLGVPVSQDSSTGSATGGRGYDLDPLIEAEIVVNEVVRGLPVSEVPKDVVLQTLAGSKAPKVEGPGAFPPESNVSKDKVSKGLHGSKVRKKDVLRRFPPSKGEKDGFLPKTQSLESSPRSEAREDEPCSGPFMTEEAEKKILEGGNSWGPTEVAKVVFLMVILAIVSKKIAVMISILAFTILLLESIGKRLIPSLTPCEEARKNLGAIAGSAAVSDLLRTLGESNSCDSGRIPIKSAGSDDKIALGYSPIKSTGNDEETGLGSSLFSENDWKVEVPGEATALTAEVNVPPLEEKGHSEIDEKATSANRKPKKLFSKFMPTKFRSTKSTKGGKLGEKSEPASDSSRREAPAQKSEPTSDSSSREAPAQNGAPEEALEEEDDDHDVNESRDGQEDLCLKISAMAHDPDLEDVPFVGANVCEPTRGNSGNLVFFLVILSGLIGGRVVSLLLTVFCCSLVPSARSLWRSWNSYRSK